MKKAQSLDAKMDRLTALAKGAASENVVDELRHILSTNNSLVLAQAAKVSRTLKVREVIAELVSAFDRCMEKVDDKGCSAKTAIAEALDALEYGKDDIFLRGVRHIQMEKVWGGSVDVAADLRVRCAIGLVRVARRDVVMRELTDLLMDSEPGPRIIAAKNLAFALPGEASELVLRLKARIGDKNSEVIENCFAGLLQNSTERYWDFVTAKLDGNDSEAAGAAMMALATSNDRARAAATLIARFDKSLYQETRELILTALGVTRMPAAFEFLLEQVKNGLADEAAMAVRALSLMGLTKDQIEQVRDVVGKRKAESVTREFADRFGTSAKN